MENNFLFKTATSTPSSSMDSSTVITLIILIAIVSVFIIILLVCWICAKYCLHDDDERTQPLEVVPGSEILPPIFYTPDTDPLKQTDLKEHLRPLI